MADNDQARILVGATASNSGYLEIATADDGTEPIYVRQYTGVFGSLTRTLTLLDGSGNSNFPGSIQTNANGIKWDESGVRSWNMFPTSGYLAITSGDGAGYFSSTMSGGIRSPIFYDNNDTGYYADPASTSVLSKLTLNSKQSAVDQGIPPTSGTTTPAIQRIYPGYSTYGEVIDIGMNVGPSYGWIQATNYTNLAVNYPLLLNPNGGNVGIGLVGAPSAKFQVRASTPTSLGGFPSGVTMLSDSNTNNYLLFRNTADNATYSGIAFQDNNIGGYVIFGNAGGGGDLLYVAGYGGGQLQYGTADSIDRTARTTVASWNATGLQVNSGDFRAPIFYDSNNTAYYVDPSSTSYMNSVRHVRGTHTYFERSVGVDVGAIGWHSDDIFYVAGHPGYGPSAGNQVRIYGFGANLYLGNSTYGDVLTVGGGYTQGTGSIRAPLFYDSDNTGYYLNPNSTSNLGGTAFECNLGTGRSSYGKANANLVLNATEASGAGYACIDFKSGGNYPSDGAQIYYESSSSGSGELSRLWLRVENDATDEIYLRAGRIYYDSNTVDGGSQNPGHVFRYAGTDRMYIYSDNTTENGSFRAPIFYDSGNTGYYVDPASTSVLNALTLGGRSTNQAMYYQGFTLDANTMDVNATGFTYAVNAPTTGPIVRFSTNGGYDMWLNAAYSGGNHLHFRTRNGDAGSINSWRVIPSYGISYADSLFASIFYDANNTGYYADFASTAADCAIFAGGIHISKGNISGQGIILADDGDIVDLNDGYCAMRFSFGVRIHSANRGGSATIRLGNGGNIIANDNITAYGSASDRRLKENVKPLVGALDKIMQLQGCTFDWKEKTDQRELIGIKEDIGFIADEVQAVVPEMVRTDVEGYLSLRDRGFSALLVEAMKEQQTQIEDQKTEISELKSLINMLVDKVNKLVD
jgi:hypothetical protein